MKSTKRTIFMSAVVGIGWMVPPTDAQTPLGSEFTYQGQLQESGAPFDGMADFDFSLWDAAVDGGQIASTVSLTDIVVAEGLFTVGLDFGIDALNGDERWLEISVNATLLAPRQRLAGTPYALQTRGLVVDGDYSVTLAPSNDNLASGEGASVGGGASNSASGAGSTIGGGGANTCTGNGATIGGGTFNTADGESSTVGGGGGFLGQALGNTASGTNSTVPGGALNTAAGDYSFAAGRRAKANHDGAFVWADSTDADFASTAADQFLISAAGGVGINETNPSAALDVVGTTELNGDVTINSNLTVDTDTLFVDATSGNVGIGTTTPSTPLAILGNGGTNPVGITQNAVGSGSTMELTTADSAGNQATRLLLRGGNDAPDIEFYTGASGSETRTMHIEGTNGNVGIGTTTPGGPLQVGEALLSSDCCVDHDGPGCDNSECEAIVCKDDPFCCDTHWDRFCADGAVELCGDLCDPPSFFLISSSGNVGINTTPTTPLAIQGNGGTSPVGITQNAVGGNRSMELTTEDGFGDQATRIVLRAGSPADIEFYSGASGLETQTMHIEGTNGNVGIGTANPSEALHVCGNIRAEGEITAGGFILGLVPGACPDYVFESDYELMPLDELGEYIQRNKHLPNVPSAEVVERDGIDLGGFSMRLLEKTEELTLYVLDQDKRLKEKDSEIQALSDRLAKLEGLIEGAAAGKGEMR